MRGAEGTVDERACQVRPHLDYARPIGRASGASIWPARRFECQCDFSIGHYDSTTPRCLAMSKPTTAQTASISDRAACPSLSSSSNGLSQL